MSTLLVTTSGPGEAAYNMSVDEALLLSMPRLGKPVLRFYSWTQRAASFGYFQKFADIAAATALRPLIRRPTGGGLVPHDADWTYSLAFPTSHEWYSVRAVESYRRVHAWLQAAFAELSIPTECAPTALKSRAGQCFVGHEENDLLWHGRKIAGAAQRRTRDGLLIQGSVQPPPVPGLTRAEWEKAICQAASGLLPETFQGDSQIEALANELLNRKYAQERYNRRR